MEKELQKVRTKEDARQYAIEWQTWQSKQAMSYSEVMEWTLVFNDLADRFNLTEEFKENGII